MNKVLVGGCFDLIHFGHIQFLKAAKAAGDYLVVMLESDENVKRLKGPNRPIHSQKERLEMLKSLRFVDEVVELPTISGYDAYLAWVKKIKPDIIAVTENDPKLDQKRKQAREVGAKLIIVISLIKSYQTTSILKEL